MTPQSPESGYLELALKGKTPGEIADLQSLLADIRFARSCAKGYVEQIEQHPLGEPDPDLLKRALWTACCISYRRVFTKGKGHLHPQRPRTRPPDDFTASLTPEQLEAHNKVLDTADKHIAHRVGELEQVRVWALLNPPPLPRAVVGLPTKVVGYVGPDVETAKRFITVCELLFTGIHDEYKRVSAVFLTLLQHGDVDQMYADAQKAQGTKGPG
jgi:hypothetical protein